MTDAQQVLLAAAFGGVLGSVVTNLGQIYALWYAAKERRVDWRRDLYISHMRFLGKLPDQAWAAVADPEGGEAMRRMSDQIQDMKADLRVMGGRRVRSAVDEMVKAFGSFAAEVKRRGEEDMKLPREQREGASEVLFKAYEDAMGESIRKLAKTMRSELDTEK